MNFFTHLQDGFFKLVEDFPSHHYRKASLLGRRESFAKGLILALGLFRNLTDLEDFKVFHRNVLQKGAFMGTSW